MKLTGTFLLTVAGVLTLVSATPGPQGAGRLAKRDCVAAFGSLVLDGPCTEGFDECEFCCPGLFNATAQTGADHCHLGHGSCTYCECGQLEWHCDDHDE